MKKYLFTVLFSGLMGILFAQTQAPNIGYEAWQNLGSAQEEPTNWNSNKTGGGNASSGPQTIYRDGTIFHNGSYSARIETKTYLFSIIVNGSMTTGKVEAPTTNPTDGYVHTIPGNADFSTPFLGRPDSLVGWYRYNSVSGDQGRIQCVLHDSVDLRVPLRPVDVPFVVADAVFLTPTSTVGSWTRFSIPFNYAKTNNPSYFLMTATSSAIPGGGSSGSKLWLDDVQVVYRPAITLGTMAPAGPYYVSNTQSAAVSVPYNAVGNYTSGNTFTVQLSNASGSFAAPTVIGTLASTNSGNVLANIPATTASGAGYRIRVLSSTPGITSDTSAAFTINLCNNPITPTAIQNMAANINGSTITVTETVAASSREWKFATSSGGPYSSFGSTQTAMTYTPNFPSAGTYFVICQSNYPGGLQVISNEVQINVVENAVTPSASQSLLVSTPGTMLTVTETPSGISREWKFGTTSGGPYSSFGSAETGMTYTPIFATPGTYYVVCISMINGIQATSNEVEINVGTTTLSTGTIAGSPFEFSPSAPAATVIVPYTASAPFTAGNEFSAQLSNASGSFASPVIIGTVLATNSGNITATIPSGTAAGSAYRIRVVGSNPGISGSDNGANLVIDQFNNSIAPTTTQTILVNTNGTAVNVTESQTATARAWKYATASGGPYTAFAPAETAASYTPNFAAPGTYFVVCESTNQYSDMVRSAEVTVIVNNGTQLTTTTATGSPYYTSASAAVTSSVSFSSNAAFASGNVFTVELSDAFGGFASPTVIGTVTSQNISPITATIPNGIPSGSGYRVRVVSSNPAIIGTDNGTDLTITQFENAVMPLDTQYLATGANGTPVSVTATHPGTTQEWKYSNVPSGPYSSFATAQTGTNYTPNFPSLNVYYVIAQSTNSWGDNVNSGELVVIVNTTSTESIDASAIISYWSNDELVINLNNANLSTDAVVELYNTAGQKLLSQATPNADIYRIATDLPKGIYILRIVDGNKEYNAKTVK